MSGLQFKRVGLGFWGSLGEWIADIGLCGLCVCLNRHVWVYHSIERVHCARCGRVG